MSDHQETLFNFPCSYPLKVFGKNDDDFENFVLSIISPHISTIEEATISSRTSQGGVYLSITVTFMAESRQQLDDIYNDLSKCKRVIMTL
jgi:putative lipoic acid-binding regulatory protein